MALHDDIKKLGIDLRAGDKTPEQAIEELCDHCEKLAFASEHMFKAIEQTKGKIDAIVQLSNFDI